VIVENEAADHAFGTGCLDDDGIAFKKRIRKNMLLESVVLNQFAYPLRKFLGAFPLILHIQGNCWGYALRFTLFNQIE
jgi:hypothetical protein